MSAPETRKPGSAAPEPRAHEPSMEEILASIRRIISDDQASPARPQRDEDAFRSELEMSLPAQEPRAGVVSSEPQRVERPPFLRGSTESATVFRHPAAQAEPQSDSPAPPRPVAPQATSGHIAAPQFAMPDMPRPAAPASREPDPDVEAALLKFTAPASPDGSRPSEDHAPKDASHPEKEDVSTDALFSSATTQSVTAAFNRLAALRLVENDAALKEMVRDMLRPLLRDWLDDNLPSMVERMVRAEIERVGRGGR